MGKLLQIRGSNIRRLRKRLNLTQEELASRVKRHPTYISGIERGVRNITINVLEDISNALAVAQTEINDEDKLPDFSIKYKGSDFTLECKNVRSGEEMKKEDGYRVEVQKTRNSKDGSNSRSYGIGEFDLLAACLFNQINEWIYLFAASIKLARKRGDDTLLATMTPVSIKPGSTWRSSLEEAIRN